MSLHCVPGIAVLVTYATIFVPIFTFAASPTIENEMKNQTIKEGKNVAFTCIVNSLGGYKVAWMKINTDKPDGTDVTILSVHDHVISNSDNVKVTHNDKNTWTLELSDVKRSDEGYYMCQINAQPKLDQRAYLEVITSPKISDKNSSEDTSVLEHKDVQLRCIAQGVPTPKIFWKKRGHKHVLSHSSILHLTNVTRQDMGTYMCIAKNGVPPTRSKSIKLHVNFPPSINIRDDVLGVPRGNNVSLQCKIEAYPNPMIFWNKEGDYAAHLVTSTPKYVMHKRYHKSNMFQVMEILTIIGIERKDYGKYSCIAKNTIGTSNATFSVFEIQGSPGHRTSTKSDYITKSLPTRAVTKSSLMNEKVSREGESNVVHNTNAITCASSIDQSLNWIMEIRQNSIITT